MAFSGIDAVLFGVSDLAEAKCFLDDSRTRSVSAWGAKTEVEFHATLERLRVSETPPGQMVCRAMSLAFRASRRRAVAATPMPPNGPGIAQRVDRRAPVHDRARPVKSCCSRQLLLRTIVIDAYRRRTGRCPATIHSLGTGEAFAVEETASGFLDLASGLRADGEASHIRLSGERALIEFTLDSDTAFSGCDPSAGERFSSHTGADASVTIYDDLGSGYFQYALIDEGK